MPNQEFDGKKINDILNPPKTNDDNKYDEEMHQLCQEMKKILDEDISSLYISEPQLKYSDVVKEEIAKGTRRMNYLYGGLAVWAFGGEYMNKLKEWWKK